MTIAEFSKITASLPWTDYKSGRKLQLVKSRLFVDRHPVCIRFSLGNLQYHGPSVSTCQWDYGQMAQSLHKGIGRQAFFDKIEEALQADTALFNKAVRTGNPSVLYSALTNAVNKVAVDCFAANSTCTPQFKKLNKQKHDALN